jgi:hypothetical protein
MIRRSQGDDVSNLKLQFKMAIDGASLTKFTTTAIKDQNQIVFADPEGQKYRFQFGEGEVHLYRDGSEELDLVFQTGNRSKGIIKISGIELTVMVYTRKLLVSDKNLRLEYDLIDGSRTLSSHALDLAWHLTDGRN